MGWRKITKGKKNKKDLSVIRDVYKAKVGYAVLAYILTVIIYLLLFNRDQLMSQL